MNNENINEISKHKTEIDSLKVKIYRLEQRIDYIEKRDNILFSLIIGMILGHVLGEIIF